MNELFNKAVVAQFPKATDGDYQNSFIVDGAPENNNAADPDIPAEEQLLMIDETYQFIIEQIKTDYEQKILDLQSQVGDNVVPKVTENDVIYLVKMLRRVLKHTKADDIPKALQDLEYTLEEYEHIN